MRKYAAHSNTEASALCRKNLPRGIVWG
jgi:dipeptidyl aminopeptidase/acylaminoacyl peptidase